MTRLSPIMKISQVFSNCPPTDCKKEEEKEEEEKLPLPNVTAPPVIVTKYLFGGYLPGLGYSKGPKCGPNHLLKVIEILKRILSSG